MGKPKCLPPWESSAPKNPKSKRRKGMKERREKETWKVRKIERREAEPLSTI